MDNEKVLTYILIGAVVVLLLVTVYAFIQPDYYGADYPRVKQAELSDKCKTPPGYSDAQWREHMSHHPDQYAECLK